MQPSSCQNNDGNALKSIERRCRLTVIDSGITTSISVVVYCQSDGNRLDAWRLRSICIYGELSELRDCSRFIRDTVAGVLT